MFSGTFEYDTTLHHPIDDVWTLFSTADNLARISSGDGGIGIILTK